jgi:hypothetical protein
MKIILTLTFILSSFICFGQKTDTLKAPTNAIQLEKLDALQRKINEDQKAFNDILELIFGARIEDVQWWGFDPKGQFKYILKPKK